MGDLPLHRAAAQGQEARVLELLAAEPGSAAEQTADGTTALHLAAAGGHELIVRHLIKAGPAALFATDRLGRLPLHCAIVARHAPIVRVLLSEAAHTATALNAYPNACCRGSTPLHWAADAGDTDIVALLLAAAPQTATWCNSHAHSALHFCIFGAHRWEVGGGEAAAVARLLLGAGATATAIDSDGDTPLHCAALKGCVELVELLAAQAPATAAECNHAGQLPITCALAEAAALVDWSRAAEPGPCAEERPQFEAFMRCSRLLLPYGPTQQLVEALAAAGPVALPLFGDLVACRRLSPEQWQLVPAGCPGLGAALPAVMQRSCTEAGCLARRLPEADRAALHAALLALARTQRQLGVALPADVARQTLCFLCQE